MHYIAVMRLWMWGSFALAFLFTVCNPWFEDKKLVIVSLVFIAISCVFATLLTALNGNIL